MCTAIRPRYLAGSAVLHSLRGEYEDAKRVVVEAIRYAEEYKLRHQVPLVRNSYGRVLAATGAHAAALTGFTAAAVEAEAMHMLPILWQARARAAAEAPALGRQSDSVHYLSAAHDAVAAIAGQFRDADLRDAFMARVERELSTILLPARG